MHRPIDLAEMDESDIDVSVGATRIQVSVGSSISLQVVDCMMRLHVHVYVQDSVSTFLGPSITGPVLLPCDEYDSRPNSIQDLVPQLPAISSSRWSDSSQIRRPKTL